MNKARYIRWFSELGIEDVPLVGGKNASLGEMYRELVPKGIKVPNGFAITAEAYRDTLTEAGIWDALRETLEGLEPEDVADLARRGARARALVYGAPLGDQLKSEIVEAYEQLRKEYGDEMSVAVRSSATAEDLPGASFAGQQETYLNIHGREQLLDSVRRCFASLFTDRAIHYRIDQGFDHFKVSLSVGVMKMVRSDLAASGVMFSLDTETGFRDVVFITAAYGLGENVVQGAVEPDEFYVHKPTFEKGHRAVLRRHLGSKKIKMLYAAGGTREMTRNVPVPETERMRFCISDEDVLTLADYAIEVEKHYSRKAGHEMPMDMEWAKDGLDGELYMVQARPETVESQKKGNVLRQYHLKEEGPILARGYAIGTRIATGRARHIVGGDEGRVYEGELEYEVIETDLSDLPRPKTRIMINLGNPDLAFSTSFLPNDGVGYEDGCDYFIRKLSEGVGTIAAAFWPKPVVVRMSDFKSNEYATLLGGAEFEPDEANPMIGFRGAARYTHPAYADGFALECAAMKRVRDEMGLTNVRLMIPFCRRVEEGKRVLEAMARHGLERGKNGLEIYVMCEIPNNVILIDQFAKLFDGFSIGSNDLTQLTLGVDRDSEMVSFDFDERDPGVKQMIRLAVEGARRNGRHSGLCGQAPSDYPEMAEYLVELGIDSMSLNPDTVLMTTRQVLEVRPPMETDRRGV